MMFRLEHDVQTGEVKKIQLSAEEIAQLELEISTALAAWEARKAAEQG